MQCCSRTDPNKLGMVQEIIKPPKRIFIYGEAVGLLDVERQSKAGDLVPVLLKEFEDTLMKYTGWTAILRDYTIKNLIKLIMNEKDVPILKFARIIHKSTIMYIPQPLKLHIQNRIKEWVDKIRGKRRVPGCFVPHEDGYFERKIANNDSTIDNNVLKEIELEELIKRIRSQNGEYTLTELVYEDRRYGIFHWPKKTFPEDWFFLLNNDEYIEDHLLLKKSNTSL